MLLGDLYTLAGYHSDNSEVNATVRLDSDHAIFKGHFPGNPILPGVCMIQLIKELAEKLCQCPLIMKEADTVKFLQAIDPRLIDQVEVQLQYEKQAKHDIKIKATIFVGTVSFFKLTATFIPGS